MNERKHVLGLPNTPSRRGEADPEHFEDVRMIEMTHDQFLKLGDRGEDIAVAAGVQQDSLRKRIMRAVALHSPVDDVDQLIGYLVAERPGAVHHHEVTHLLYGLNKDGCLKFRENKRDARAGTAHLQRIEVTDRGYDSAGVPVPGKAQEGRRGARNAGTSRKGHAVGRDMTEQRHHRTIAEGGPVMSISTPTGSSDPAAYGAETFAASMARYATEPRVQAPQMKPTTNEEPAPEPSWPELQRIRALRQAAMAASLRAEAYYDAAAALESVDPAESKRMLARAEEVAGPGLTPAEAEYLRFVDGLERDLEQ